MGLATPTPPQPSQPGGDVLPTMKAALPSRPARPIAAHRQYQQAQIETATPTRLIVLLYDGAIRFCSLAIEAMQARDLETQNTNLIKAQRILAELMGSLDRKAGGQVADNLFGVYTFMLNELVQANLHDEIPRVESVVTLLKDLRESWVQLDLLTTQAQASASEKTPASPESARPAAAKTAAPTPQATKAPSLPAPAPVAPKRLGDQSA